jgi:hypothetical protein
MLPRFRTFYIMILSKSGLVKGNSSVRKSRVEVALGHGERRSPNNLQNRSTKQSSLRS